MKNELTWDDVEEKIGKLGFTWEGAQSNGKLYQIEIQKHSKAGQDCHFTLQCDKDDPASVAMAFQELYEDYDVDREAYIWLDSDGHGKNGAPYHMVDVVKDMQGVQETLQDAAVKMERFVNNFSVEYSKEEIKEAFAKEFSNIYGTEPVEEKHAINACKQTVERIVENYPGDPKQKKALLSDYLKEIGINDGNASTYAKALNKVQLVHNNNLLLDKLRTQPLDTTRPMMSSTEVGIHRMFDTLFNKSDTNPVDYAQFVIDASGHATLNGLKGERWWADAVNHAVNSGGSLWQDSAERVRLFEAFGLIHNDYEDPALYGPCYDTYKAYMKEYGTKAGTVTFTEFVDKIFPNKNEMTEYLQKDQTLLREYKKFDGKKEDYLMDKYMDKADKMYGEYMHKYLKDLCVLDNDKRDKKIAKQKEWENRVSRR